jgi:hypothetical protein
MPLNMLLFGNFSRLDLVEKAALNHTEKSTPAKKRFDKEAEKTIRMITKKERYKEEL